MAIAKVGPAAVGATGAESGAASGTGGPGTGTGTKNKVAFGQTRVVTVSKQKQNVIAGVIPRNLLGEDITKVQTIIFIISVGVGMVILGAVVTWYGNKTRLRDLLIIGPGCICIGVILFMVAAGFAGKKIIQHRRLARFQRLNEDKNEEQLVTDVGPAGQEESDAWHSRQRRPTVAALYGEADPIKRHRNVVEAPTDAKTTVIAEDVPVPVVTYPHAISDNTGVDTYTAPVTSAQVISATTVAAISDPPTEGTSDGKGSADTSQASTTDSAQPPKSTRQPVPGPAQYREEASEAHQDTNTDTPSTDNPPGDMTVTRTPTIDSVGSASSTPRSESHSKGAKNTSRTNSAGSTMTGTRCQSTDTNLTDV